MSSDFKSSELQTADTFYVFHVRTFMCNTFETFSDSLAKFIVFSLSSAMSVKLLSYSHLFVFCVV